MVWGATFLVVHIAMQYSGPWFFVGLRFLAAAAISVLIFRRSLRHVTAREIAAGVSIGTMIFLGYGLQTFGLQTIDSSTSAFITALYVPMVPLLQWLVFRKAPGPMTWLGVALAFVGLVLIANPFESGVVFGPGQIATLISTVAIAGEIILIGWFAGRVHLGRVTVIQLFVAGLLSFMTMPIVGEQFPAFDWVWLVAAIGLGAASCLIQLTMNWAQRTVDPTRATVIYASEPVWAGIVGRIAGERLPAISLLGAAFIVAGVLLSELKPRRRELRTLIAEPVVESSPR